MSHSPLITASTSNSEPSVSASLAGSVEGWVVEGMDEVGSRGKGLIGAGGGGMEEPDVDQDRNFARRVSLE
eukprot:CAMPEP_0118642860 /NCGR_PEP_ID=MMETSP0785-20121206/6061_1 /TAXON_ID=91992 /ORGANISM="Bolidomonas pacifica, Strain CCMP 1866" /LENGTH=70 /DNA_ID=CAMNT_0006534441 /DNA_START=33 /DNA_END=245 /DNA_ORIENTATION=-